MTKKNFERLPDALARAGYALVAPVKKNGLTLFKYIEPGDAICFEDVNTRLSIKEFFFPRCEPLVAFSRANGEVALSDVPPPERKTVILGCRGCDASSLPAMDALFNWDMRDTFYNKRRANTTVISMACGKCDECCFCSSVGGDPHNTKGSDVMLSAATDGGWLAEVVSDRGGALVEELSTLFEEEAPEPLPYAEVKVKFDLDAAIKNLRENFDSAIWDEISYKCLSCGVCTYVCPNCHCFDIQDEASRTRGARVRHWDGCQFALFTKHTSGHNPRPTQGSRWRQRVQHKFNYYVQKFNCVSCVGCGRCIRHCPVNMDISEHLARIARGESAKTENSTQS